MHPPLAAFEHSCSLPGTRTDWLTDFLGTQVVKELGSAVHKEAAAGPGIPDGRALLTQQVLV